MCERGEDVKINYGNLFFVNARMHLLLFSQFINSVDPSSSVSRLTRWLVANLIR